MKQLVSLKQLLPFSFIMSVIILSSGCQKEYEQPVKLPFSQGSTTQSLSQTSVQTPASLSSNERIYLDLTKDQMIPGGISNAMLQAYLNQGYTLQTLTADKFAKHVGFKSSNGNIYYVDGWLKKGTKYLMRKKFEPYILMACGNPEMDFWPDVE